VFAGGQADVLSRSNLSVTICAFKQQDKSGLIASERDVDVKLVVAKCVFLEDLDPLAGKELRQVVAIQVLRAFEILWSEVSVSQIAVRKISRSLIEREFTAEIA
jgi:hypothetical protein